MAPPENTSSPSVDAESDSEEYNSDLEKYDQEGRGHARQNARYMQTKVTIQTHTGNDTNTQRENMDKKTNTKLWYISDISRYTNGGRV